VGGGGGVGGVGVGGEGGSSMGGGEWVYRVRRGDV